VAVGKGKGKKKGKDRARPKRDYSLEAEAEERLLEWMAEHDEAWRRGHRLYKKRKEIWAAKADELGVTLDHIMGWWKSLKDWYVRLNKVKSGQAAKKHTDREKFILASCKFYQKQLPSHTSSPMITLHRRPQETPVVSESEADSDHGQQGHEQQGTPQEDLEVAESSSAQQASSRSQSRQSKKRQKVDQEEEWMKDLRDTLKANQQLLGQLVKEKPAQSDREVFIKYVADSLHTAQEDKYKQLKTQISAILDAADPDPPRPGHTFSAPPGFPPSQQYQQQGAQQGAQQYMQQAPQYQQYQQYQQQYQQPQYQQHQQQYEQTAQFQQFQQGAQQSQPSRSSASSASADLGSADQMQ
jgi:hypothetical protein